jgi:peroxin-11B
MRLFRSLDFLQDGLTALNSNDGVERLLGLVKGLALCCWLLCDHVQWLQKVGTLRLDKDKMARIDVHHSRAWFVGLLTGALLAVYKLTQIAEEERRLRSAAISDADRTKQMASIDAKRTKQLKGFIKNGVDLAIPSARLGWLPVSDATVGWCGTITSIMGIMDTYPAATNKVKAI